MSPVATWLAIGVCVSQSAAMSGLNLAVFTVGRLHLEAAAAAGDPDARKVLALRRDANFTLVTILWANVAINVALTLLAGSVLFGLGAFFFSTVVITFAGEIIPQAWFSRHALPVAARLSPLLRVYQVVLWPVARPVGLLLDRWVGPEGVPWFREEELADVLRRHARSDDTDLGHLETTGAVNFLRLDDLPVRAEGEPLDPASVVELPVVAGRPVFPDHRAHPDDPFLRRLAAPSVKWVVIVDALGHPQMAIDAPSYLRSALFGGTEDDPFDHCHHPLVVTDPDRPLAEVIGRLTVQPRGPGDDVIDRDVVLVWPDAAGDRRVITGADLLGRLLRGIARVTDPPAGQEGGGP